MAINPIQISQLTPPLNSPASGAGFPSLDSLPGQVDVDLDQSNSFGGMISNLLSTTNSKMTEANQKSLEMLAGENKNIHEVMIALEKADISFKFLNQVRNKAVDAYTEIFRMQL